MEVVIINILGSRRQCVEIHQLVVKLVSLLQEGLVGYVVEKDQRLKTINYVINKLNCFEKCSFIKIDMNN